MNLKLMLGLALFLIGILTAVMGIAGVGRPDVSSPVVVSEDSKSNALTEALGNMALPAIAGLSLAIGGPLIGLSMGNWKNPRTTLQPGDEVVDPEGYRKMKHV